MPTLTFTIKRNVLFAASWAMFIALDGHIWPYRILHVRTESFAYPLSEAWGYCIAGFLIGAIMFSYVDHKVGDITPVNLRIGYVIVGIFLMAVSLLAWNLIKLGG